VPPPELPGVYNTGCIVSPLTQLQRISRGVHKCAVIERLWDDRDFEAALRRHTLAEAMRWDRETLADQYEAFLLCSARG
jgi:hypothetical protein